MATVYVKKTGDDTNDGTRENPVLTVQRAAYMIGSAAEANSEIIIMDDETYVEGLIGQNAGTPVSPTINLAGLTIMAETGSDGFPVVSPVIQGSGSGNNQRYAFYCSQGWTIKGLTFENFDITNSTDSAVITNRSPGNGWTGITVEQCTFRHITGSCITFSRGSFLPDRHFVKSNTFHDITTNSNTTQLCTIVISDGSTERFATVVNNVFYDWQPQHTGGRFILGGTTNSQLPRIIISHNTFGTSSTEANEGSTTRALYGVSSPYSKFEYNIIKDQTMEGSGASFAHIDNGEANYNIYFNVAGTSAHAPFGRLAAPTGSTGNQEIDPQLKGPLVGDSANYRLAGTSSPAFDAAIGSSDVTTDRTAKNRTTLDESALATGIFDIGAYELTGLWSSEQPDSLPQVGGDFTINRIPNADNQWKRGLSEGNSGALGHDVDQVPLTTAINGAIPSFIRKRPTANTQETGKKG
jgi:hypothetical protein